MRTADAKDTDGDTLAARVARLERLVGVSSATAVPAGGRARRERSQLGDWLTAHRKPGNAVAGIVVGTDKASASARHSFAGDNPPVDLRGVADLCQALASEARLSLLRELFRGPRGRAELMTAAGVDRGQLYHHLRDLFVHGLVEQPERGRYALTGRGTVVFLAAGLLPQLSGPVVARPNPAELDLGEREEEGAGGTAIPPGSLP